MIITSELRSHNMEPIAIKKLPKETNINFICLILETDTEWHGIKSRIVSPY